MGFARRQGRRRGLLVGAAAGSAVARHRARAQDTEQSTPMQDDAAPAAENDQLDQLEKLGQLKANGVLTDQEFQAKKSQILGM
jgi:hypothetical protein